MAKAKIKAIDEAKSASRAFDWKIPNKHDRECYVSDTDDAEKFCVDLTKWRETPKARQKLKEFATVLGTLKKNEQLTLGIAVTCIDTFYSAERTLGDRVIPDVIRSPQPWMTVKGTVTVADFLKVINNESVNCMGDFSHRLFPYKERKTGVVENNFAMCGPESENLFETYEEVDGELNGGEPLSNQERKKLHGPSQTGTLGVSWSGPEHLKLIIDSKLVEHTLSKNQQEAAKEKANKKMKEGQKASGNITSNFKSVTDSIHIERRGKGFYCGFHGTSLSGDYKLKKVEGESLEELLLFIRQYWVMKKD